MAEGRLGIGLIGAGANMRERHIPGFQAIEGVEIVSVVNRSRESGERVAAAYGISKVAASVEELLADPAVDAVCIGTWPYKHREYTVAALKAGKHVLCEARMAGTLEDAEAMLRASEAHPELVAQLVPAPFDFRLGPTITRLVRASALGEIVDVSVTVLNGSGLDALAPLHWRHQQRYSGHNVMSLGIYAEVLGRWLGDASEVRAMGTITVNERLDPDHGGPGNVDIPDDYRVIGQLARGAAFGYHVSAVCAGAPANGIVLYGTEGTLRWALNDRATIVRGGGEPEEVKPDPGTDRGWRVEADFVDSVRTGAPVTLTSFADGMRYMRFVDACWQSWQEGRAIRLQSAREQDHGPGAAGGGAR